MGHAHRQAATLAALQTAGGKVPRAWAHKETVRQIFTRGLSVAAVEKLIDRLLARLSRSRLPPQTVTSATGLGGSAASPSRIDAA